MCANHCAPFEYTVEHRTVPTIFTLILQSKIPGVVWGMYYQWLSGITHTCTIVNITDSVPINIITYTNSTINSILLYQQHWLVGWGLTAKRWYLGNSEADFEVFAPQGRHVTLMGVKFGMEEGTIGAMVRVQDPQN